MLFNICFINFIKIYIFLQMYLYKLIVHLEYSHKLRDY